MLVSRPERPPVRKEVDYLPWRETPLELITRLQVCDERSLQLVEIARGAFTGGGLALHLRVVMIFRASEVKSMGV